MNAELVSKSRTRLVRQMKNEPRQVRYEQGSRTKKHLRSNRREESNIRRMTTCVPMATGSASVHRCRPRLARARRVGAYLRSAKNGTLLVGRRLQARSFETIKRRRPSLTGVTLELHSFN